MVVNHNGDMIVRPSFIELSVEQQPGGALNGFHLSMYMLEVYLHCAELDMISLWYQAWCTRHIPL